MDEARTQSLELQAIIVSDDEGDKLSVLTEDSPKSLLPIANYPMIHLPLTYLEHNGLKDVIIVLNKKNSVKINAYLKDGYKGKLSINAVTLEEGEDTADAIRYVHKYIKSDFIVMSDDLVIDVPLVKLLNIHRSHNSSATMVINHKSKEEGEEKDKNVALDYVGLVNYSPTALERPDSFKNPSRVVYFSPSSQLKKSVTVGRSFMRKWGNVMLSKSFADSHLYVFSRWVSDLIQSRNDFVSLKNHVIPFLVDSQRYVKDKLQRHLQDNNFKTLTEFLESEQEQSGNQEYEVFPGISAKSIARTQQPALDMSSSSYSLLDLVRIYAHVVSASSKTSSTKNTSEPTPSPALIKRANTLNNYMDLNRELSKKGEYKLYESMHDQSITNAPTPTADSSTDKSEDHNTPTSEEVQIGSDCIVGKGLQYTGTAATQQGSRRVSSTLKKCNLGHNVKIGSNVKIANSVVMNNVIIGDNCTIQNSIVCCDVDIKPSANLNNCQVASGCVVEGRDYKAEALSNKH
ncbi:hypothetical protein AKO1_008629 [Acrasis kona]|uniref:Translation initiation factor eIF2B subunit gamma n=1 Tax=Acrasis kona TaxID=1008807 RepID=A0AAW2YND4_9EUKA